MDGLSIGCPSAVHQHFLKFTDRVNWFTNDFHSAFLLKSYHPKHQTTRLKQFNIYGKSQPELLYKWLMAKYTRTRASQSFRRVLWKWYGQREKSLTDHIRLVRFSHFLLSLSFHAAFSSAGARKLASWKGFLCSNCIFIAHFFAYFCSFFVDLSNIYTVRFINCILAWSLLVPTLHLFTTILYYYFS